MCSVPCSTSSPPRTRPGSRRRAPPCTGPAAPHRRPHPSLRLHAPQESARVLAWTRWAGGRGGGKRATRGDGERVQQARQQASALTRSHVGQVGTNFPTGDRGRQAGPPRLAARQGERLVTAKVPNQRRGKQLMQHLRLRRAWHAKAVPSDSPRGLRRQKCPPSGRPKCPPSGVASSSCRTCAARIAAAKSACRKPGDCAEEPAATNAEAAPDAMNTSGEEFGPS